MLIFESQTIQNLLTRARRFARSSGTVLITGETGTGKELIAQYLHNHSPRADRPCIRVNCAAFHDGLAESELFGHELGAFTGASRRHDGLLHAAGDGTLFLDEIGELPLPTQAKLLRVLEAQEYLRVGSTEVQKMNARIIAATNRDLAEDVHAGKFREDLFHRLDVLSLHVPSLRQRPDDILPLIRHFLSIFGQENETPVTDISPDVLMKLQSYAWPGNVRQLRNAIHRACVDCDGSVIEQVSLNGPTESLAALQPQPDDGLPSDLLLMPLDDIERLIILDRIRSCKGNKTAAAAALGVTTRTLRNKLSRWNDAKAS